MNSNEEKDKLETIQYEDIYHEDDVPLQDGSDRVVSRLIYFGFGLFIVLIIASFLVKLPRQIHIPFELKGGNVETIFQYHEQVYVKNTLVHIGDTLIPGQPLIEIGSEGISDCINQIESIQRNIRFFELEEQKVYNNTIRNKKVQRSCLFKEVGDLENELEIAIQSKNKEEIYLQELVQIQQAKFDRNKALYDSGYVSKQELEQLSGDYTNARQKLASAMAAYDLNIASLKSNIQSRQNENILLQKDIEQLRITHMRDSAALYSDRDRAKNKLQTIYGRYSIVGRNIQLLCPDSGMVSYISSNEAEVPSREILLKIENDKQEYVVYAEATSAQVGQLAPGNKVVLKYFSFPYYYYGTMKSSIDAISLSSNEDGNYSVVMHITDTGRLKNKVSKGMTGKASVVIEEKSISDFIFRSFLRGTAIE